jgi:hypothetical protein
MTNEHLDPAEALALTQGARRRLTERELSPWWYAPLYGLAIGGMVAVTSGPRRYVGFTIVFVVAAVALHRFWASRAGVSVTGFRKGRTLWVTAGLLAALLGVSFATLRLSGEGYGWAPLAGGAVAAVVAAVGSRLWDRVWLSELRG